MKLTTKNCLETCLNLIKLLDFTFVTYRVLFLRLIPTALYFFRSFCFTNLCEGVMLCMLRYSHFLPYVYYILCYDWRSQPKYWLEGHYYYFSSSHYYPLTRKFVQYQQDIYRPLHLRVAQRQTGWLNCLKQTHKYAQSDQECISM